MGSSDAAPGTLAAGVQSHAAAAAGGGAAIAAQTGGGVLAGGVAAAAVAGWLAGSGVQLQQAALAGPGWVACAFAGAAVLATLAVLALRARTAQSPLVAAVLVATTFAAALAGWAATEWRAAQRLADRLQPALEGQDLVLTGVVAEMPRVALTGTRFAFEVESALHRGLPVAVPPRVALTWFRGFDGDALLAAAPPDLRAGQRWRLVARLRQPHGSLNPHGFDVELWLFERGLRASGYVRAAVGPMAPERLDDAPGYAVARMRQALREAIAARLDDPAVAGVLAALVVGDQAAIHRDDWEVFRITGVSHLMSISGLHVTMFAWLAGAAIGALWRRSAQLSLALPAPAAARWGGLLCAAGYAVLAGWGVPAQRTVWMLATVVAVRSLALRWPLPMVLGAAAAVVVAADPWAMLQPGFWLSFVAVALLVASEPATAAPRAGHHGERDRDRWAARVWRAARGGLRTQAVATAGLAPLTLLFFQQVSLVGFVANAVAIPLVTLVIVPLALAGVLLQPLWSLAGALVQALRVVLEWLAGWPMALWWAAAAPAAAVALGVLAGVLCVLPLPWRWRLLAVPLALPLLAPVPSAPPAGRFELVAVDVGQGTAVLVRTRHHLLVYDAGPRWSPEADAGSRVLLPLLRARGERRIDTLLLSHADSDHTGGAAALLAGLPVGALLHSLPQSHALLGAAAAAGAAVQRCEAGRHWTWDGVRFEILFPEPDDLALAARPNARSCVLRVAEAGIDRAAGRSVLLTGDIETAQEAALVRRHGAALRSTVLLVPHHGSRTSSTPALLDTVTPQLALVQAGYRSRFGHPAPQVLARYEARGITVVRSDRCGAFTLPARPQTQAAGARPAADAPLAGRCQRQAARRYWHHPGDPAD